MTELVKDLFKGSDVQVVGPSSLAEELFQKTVEVHDDLTEIMPDGWMDRMLRAPAETNSNQEGEGDWVFPASVVTYTDEQQGVHTSVIIAGYQLEVPDGVDPAFHVSEVFGWHCLVTNGEHEIGLIVTCPESLSGDANIAARLYGLETVEDWQAGAVWGQIQQAAIKFGLSQESQMAQQAAYEAQPQQNYTERVEAYAGNAREGDPEGYGALATLAIVGLGAAALYFAALRPHGPKGKKK